MKSRFYGLILIVLDLCQREEFSGILQSQTSYLPFLMILCHNQNVIFSDPKKQLQQLLLNTDLIMWDWSGTIVDNHNNLLQPIRYWITWLHGKHKIQAIVSNASNPQALRSSIRELQLEKFFGENIICCGNDLYRPKPATDMFFELMRKVNPEGVPVSEFKVVYIGDTRSDALFADQCGCEFRNVAEFLCQHP